MSYSNYLEDKINDAVCNNVALQIAQAYCKLHIGDPGEDCTANAATETTRKAVSFGASASGTATNDTAVDWTNVAGTETISHFSLWDASSAGNALGSGALTASKAVVAGDNFSFPIAGLTFVSA